MRSTNIEKIDQRRGSSIFSNDFVLSSSPASFHEQARKRQESRVQHLAGIHGSSSQLSTMTFNNQDTVLLRVETDIHLCFLHDNRIFIFKKKAFPADQADFVIPNPNCSHEYQVDTFEETGQSVEDLCVSLILHLMTTPKFRLLNSTYIVFATSDHWIFLSIVVMIMVSYGVQTSEDFVLSKLLWSLPVTFAVLLEIFVGITMNSR